MNDQQAINKTAKGIETVATATAQVAVGTTGAVIGGSVGLVAGVVAGIGYGTYTGVIAGWNTAIGLIWKTESTATAIETVEVTATAIVKKSQAEVKAEIDSIKAEMRDLAGPAGKQKRGRGRPKKADVIDVDIDSMDSQELRDYMAGKNHLAPDPIF